MVDQDTRASSWLASRPLGLGLRGWWRSHDCGCRAPRRDQTWGVLVIVDNAPGLVAPILISFWHTVGLVHQLTPLLQHDDGTVATLLTYLHDRSYSKGSQDELL